MKSAGQQDTSHFEEVSEFPVSEGREAVEPVEFLGVDPPAGQMALAPRDAVASAEGRGGVERVSPGAGGLERVPGSPGGIDVSVPLPSPAARRLVWPALGSALLWAGSELVPRLAEAAVGLLGRSSGSSRMRGRGGGEPRRRRQRRGRGR